MNQQKQQIRSREWPARIPFCVLLVCVLAVFSGTAIRSVSAEEKGNVPSLLTGKISAGDAGEAVPRLKEGEVRYRMKVPVKDDGTAPASPVTAVTVFPGGADPTELKPVVRGPSGTRRAASFLWARNDEPIRVLFDTSEPFASDQSFDKHVVFYLSLLHHERVDNAPEWTRRHGLTLASKNYGPSVAENFDHSSLDAFIEQWNEIRMVDGRSLVSRIQHGYHLHQPYGQTPLEYMASRGAPLSLNRYRGYFRVEEPDRSKIGDLKDRVKKNRSKVKELEEKLKELNGKVEEARKKLKEARESGDENQIENRKTVFEEWEFRRDKLEKQKLPKARRKLEYARGAISEIRNNTYTFLTGSAGASWVLVDGKQVASWPANKRLPKRNDKYYGYREGAVNLEPGIHRVEYLYAATGSKYLTFMLWRRPAERKPKIMEPERFGGVGKAQIVGAVTGSGARPPGWKLVRDSRIPNVPDFVVSRFRVPGSRKEEGSSKSSVYRWRFGDGATARGRTVDHLYLESGTYDVTLEAYEKGSDDKLRWSVTQPVRVHVPYDLDEYIKTSKLKKFILDKDLSVYPVRHLLNALKAVEQLDPDRLSHTSWRRHVLNGLAERADALAKESVDWTVRAGEISLGPTVALYEGAFRFFEAASGMLERFSPRWNRVKLREVQAHLMVRGSGGPALEMLDQLKPYRHEVAPEQRVAWWGIGSEAGQKGTLIDVGGEASEGELQGERKAAIVDEKTHSALELNGEGGGVRLPIPVQAVIDRDGDGSEQVTLDGTVSTDSDGTISTYRWLKDGEEVATGETADVNLDVGRHNMTLTVTDDEGKTDVETVNVNVEHAELLHYDLDEGTGSTAVDRSGRGHDGILAGPLWSSNTPDKSSSSLSFDGNDDLAISGINYNSSGHPEVTVAAWVKTSDGSDQVLVSFDRSEYWRLEINGTGAGPGALGWDLNTDSGGLDFGGTTRIDDGTWHHVAAVYDNGTAILYIDGQKEASAKKGSTFGSGSTRYGFVGVGSEASSFNGQRGPNSYLNGMIDDVRIYDTALPPSRIQEIASVGDNKSPDAEHDRAVVKGETSIKVEVLANDLDSDGDPLSVSAVSSPSGGTATINEDGTITYTPNGNFQGPDRFDYTVHDGSGGRDSATVNVSSGGAPVAEAGLSQPSLPSFTLSFRMKFPGEWTDRVVLLRDEHFTLWLEEGVPVLESEPDMLTERAEHTLETGRWYSFVLMREGGNNMRLFVDGEEVISGTISNNDPYLQELHLGEGDTRFRVMDVRVFRGVLSPVERLKLTVDRSWLRTRAEALLSAGRGDEATELVENWADVTERIIPPDPVRQSATIRRIESLVERGSDQALLAARENINDLLMKAPRRLLSGDFNITVLDMYLGRGANRVALNHAERFLHLPLASSHEEKIMARRVMALARLGKLQKAREAFDELEERYPYGEGLRMARKELEDRNAQ